jgi:hypothetical protein
MTDEQTNRMIRSTLDFDPVAEAEDMGGEGNIGLSLAFVRDKVNMMRRLMEETGDVHNNLSYDEYCAVAEGAGFERVYTQQFKSDQGYPEQFRVYWNPLGFLLSVESYSWESGRSSVNSAKIYYNIRVERDSMSDFRSHTSSGGWEVWDDDTNEYIWGGSHDTRNALLYHVEQLSKAGGVMPQWHSLFHIWLLNYSETKVPGWDSDAINRAKIEQFPQELRDMLLKAMDTHRVFNDTKYGV